MVSNGQFAGTNEAFEWYQNSNSTGYEVENSIASLPEIFYRKNKIV